jgi:hypothetical protein
MNWILIFTFLFLPFFKMKEVKPSKTSTTISQPPGDPGGDPDQ